MSRKVISILLVITLALLVGAGCSKPSSNNADNSSAPEAPPAGESPKPKDETISIAAASMGGGFFIIAGSWATLLNKHAKLSTSVEVTGGAIHNLQLVNSGQTKFGLSNNGPAYEDYYDKNNQNTRALAVVYPIPYQMSVLEKVNANCFADLKDYSLSIGPAGSGHNHTAVKILGALDIKPKKLQSLPLEDSGNLIRDGMLDGIFITSTAPVPILKDLESTHKMKLVPLTGEEADKVSEKYPYMTSTTIPANTYKNQAESVETLSDWTILIANKDVSDDLVYTVLKTTFERVEDVMAAFPAAKEMKIEYAPKLAIPLHPGAIKFYEEKGITIPDKLIPPEYKK